MRKPAQRRRCSTSEFCGVFGKAYRPPFQNVADGSDATSWMVSWQWDDVHDIWLELIRVIMSGVLLCFGSSSKTRIPA
jgi:hypothetical protein